MAALNTCGQHERALEVASDFDDTSLDELHLDIRLELLMYRGQALAGLGQRAEALATFLSALRQCRAAGGFKAAEVGLLLLAASVADATSAHERLCTRRKLILEAVELSEAIGGCGHSTEAYEACAKVHAEMGEHEAAYGFLAKAVEAKGQALTASALNRSVALQISHQTERAKAEANHHREMAATLQRSNAALQTLARIGQEITAHLDERTVFNVLASNIGELLAADHLSVYVLQASGQTLVCEFGVEEGGQLPELSVALSDDRSLVAQCARDRSVLAVQWDPESSPSGRVISGTRPTVSLLFAPMVVGDRLLGVASVQSRSAHAYTEREQQIFLSLCAYVAIAFANAQAYRDLTTAQAELARTNEMLHRAYLQQEEASNTDPLTQLRNRRFITEQLEKETALVARLPVDESGRRAMELVFFVIDVDHFKAVNDTWGHAAGDAVLRQIAERLRRIARQSDYVVRWGGEEFLYVARMSSPIEAPVVAERICSAVAHEPFVLPGDGQLPKTCSVGFAPYATACDAGGIGSWERSVELADQALYKAKQEGRNRWVGFLPCDPRHGSPNASLRSHEQPSLALVGRVSAQ